MSKTWIGRCAVCGKTSGYFQRATYDDAPDGGVTVHRECLARFYSQLEDEQWKADMEEAYQQERANIIEEEDVEDYADVADLGNDNEGITVIYVFRALRIEPVPQKTWAVGAAARDLFKSRNAGAAPEKKLFKKTNGTGSHCFAVYPVSYFADIERIIRSMETEEQRQGDLF